VAVHPVMTLIIPTIYIYNNKERYEATSQAGVRLVFSMLPNF